MFSFLLCQNENGRSALHYAVSMRRHGIVQLLVRHGSWINQPDHQEQAPLDMAFEVNEFRVVAYLLKCGARGNRPDTFEKNLWKGTAFAVSPRSNTITFGIPHCAFQSILLTFIH
jgi:ankyrin repeat protein